MSSVTTLSEHACFGGVQGFYEHFSATIGLPMRFGVYRPGQVRKTLPALFYLAGLTCNHETFAIKAGAHQHAARHGMLLVTPDTSPRATGVEGADTSWDFGHGAGFYLDAIHEPWKGHWRMETYITQELRTLVEEHFGADTRRRGIFGHSMGGHGALTLALRHAGLYQTVSAFAPIGSPASCPWGAKAFTGYLGPERARWREHDAAELVKAGARAPHLLIDQGLADQFLTEQLRPELLEAACSAAGQPLTLRRHGGYDHSYHFIATFMADHMAHHATTLA